MGQKPIDSRTPSGRVKYQISQPGEAFASWRTIKEKNCEAIKTKQPINFGQYWQANLLSMIHYWHLAILCCLFTMLASQKITRCQGPETSKDLGQGANCRTLGLRKIRSSPHRLQRPEMAGSLFHGLKTRKGTQIISDLGLRNWAALILQTSDRCMPV